MSAPLDTNAMPCHVLQLRGTTEVDDYDGLLPEYAAAARRYAEADQDDVEPWLARLESERARIARLTLKPDWVGLLDFESRFPKEVMRFGEKGDR